MQGFIILMHNMIKGTYIFYQDGKEICRSSNVITKFGKRFLTNFIAGNILDPAKDMAFGIDSTTATVDDTRLGFEFYRVPVLLNSTDIQTVGSNTTYSVVYKTTIPQDVSGVISEVGLYPSTRRSINNFDSKFLSDFDNFLDWTDSDEFNPDVVATGAKIGDNVLTMSSDSTSANEYTSSVALDLSGYSDADSIRLAYYKNNANLQNIILKFYSSDTDYYSTTITPATGTGYKITEDVLLSTLFTSPTGTPNKSQINKIGITITPTSSNTTSIGLDGLRINDEDTFDPEFGLISRSVLGTVLTKLNGRQVDVEYKLDLSF
jgi:hypothetical protein